ncbi:unnamed protein product [marine sediment metagenome]|uniref:Uncharacterized protein n=1 Tax=marine sediment metagenome TaxID=412755 RepID=X1T3G5_9ZZZZ
MYVENMRQWYPKFNRYRLNGGAVKILNEICAKVDPILILSSDWKNDYSIADMNEFFEWCGITHKIGDYTSSLWKVRFTSFQQLEECRAAEILLYVHEREVENYVAIDDLDLSPWIPNNFVHTPNSNMGIKTSNVREKIIKILTI